MGLLDILTGMQNSPQGNQSPAGQTAQKSGGMSPLMMALLGLLAYKAFKGGNQPAPSMPTSGGGGLGDILGGLLGGGRPSGTPTSGTPSGMPSPGAGSGGLGDILSGALGGSVLSGGLGNLMKQMQQSGYGRQAQSWVGHGENEAIPPDELAKALGADDIEKLTQQTGMNRDELLSGLSQHLPNFVDQLTPEGRLPTEEEATEMA